MNASWPWEANTRWTAFPECERRKVNRKQRVDTPASCTHTSPKSTSASAPGRWSWSTNPTGTDRPASAAICGRRRAT